MLKKNSFVCVYANQKFVIETSTYFFTETFDIVALFTDDTADFLLSKVKRKRKKKLVFCGLIK